MKKLIKLLEKSFLLFLTLNLFLWISAFAKITGLPTFIINISLILYLFILVIFLIKTISYIFIKKWKKLIINIFLLIASLLIFIFVFFLVLLSELFGPSEDNFAKDIVIPKNLIMEEPIWGSNTWANIPTDIEWESLIKSFSWQENNSWTEVNLDLFELNEFSWKNRNLLLNYLASSPKWFVTEEEWKLYAYRRFIVNWRWQNSLNWYYKSSDFNKFSKEWYQFRILIWIDGEWMVNEYSPNVTEKFVGDEEFIFWWLEHEYYNGKISHFVLKSDWAILEIYEESKDYSRPFTKLAISQIKKELKDVLDSQSIDTSKYKTSSDKEDITLINWMQWWIYFVNANINPWEEWYVYLKVFEVTKNIPLSEISIKEDSTEYIWWSNKPEDKFFYNTEIIIYEWDWWDYYPARFELWFVPKKWWEERKITEKVFKIEWWQR